MTKLTRAEAERIEDDEYDAICAMAEAKEQLLEDAAEEIYARRDLEKWNTP